MVLSAKLYSALILLAFTVSGLKDMSATTVGGDIMKFDGGRPDRVVLSNQDAIGDDLAGSDGMAFPGIPSLKAMSDIVRNNCGI